MNRISRIALIGLGLSAMVSSATGEVVLEIVRQVRVSFPTEFRTRYQILTSTDVGSESWAPFGDPFEGTGEIFTFNHDTEGPGRTFFSVEEMESLFAEFSIPGTSIEMMSIPADTFLMGSPPIEEVRIVDEWPQTTVTISRPFWMSRYEATQGEFQELMGYNPSQQQQAGLNAPVHRVSWNEAMEYCRRLTEREGMAERLPEGYEYRLPT